MSGLILRLRKLSDLVGYARFSPTSYLLVWYVVDIFSQQVVSVAKIVVYLETMLIVFICVLFHY